MILWIAKLGGFLSRKHDGETGQQKLWRGFQHLPYITDMFMIMRQNELLWVMIRALPGVTYSEISRLSFPLGVGAGILNGPSDRVTFKIRRFLPPCLVINFTKSEF